MGDSQREATEERKRGGGYSELLQIAAHCSLVSIFFAFESFDIEGFNVVLVLKYEYSSFHIFNANALTIFSHGIH